MKKVSSVILATIVAIASGLLPAGAATPKKGVTIKGEVISATDGRPIDFASVVLSPSKLYSMTDQDGRFTIEGAAAGEITVSVQYYGMEQKDTTFRAASGQTVNLRLALTETSFRLDNVVVVATANKAGSSTASKISRQAMDHMQTSSLADAMSLLPGVSVSNPTLSDAQTISIRGGSAMNSLGTAIIVDGALCPTTPTCRPSALSSAARVRAARVSDHRPPDPMSAPCPRTMWSP